MTARIPLIVNPSAEQIQELPSGDSISIPGHVSITGNLNITGLSTFAGNINANGNIVGDNSTNISGISSVTATTHYGSGANLTNLPASGSNTQIQYNNSGTFAGSNLRYNSGALDGSLDFSNTAGDTHARIGCYHDTLSGGDNALYFYGDLDVSTTWNLKVDNNAVTVAGAFSKGSGSFRIPHPLSTLKDTKDLIHSFIEGPQCDNIYRGKIDLVDGTATVNLDTKSNMTAGTFVALNRDIQCFTSNETGWGAVKGSVSGNILTITAQDNSSTDTISWMVVGERQDDNIKSSVLTDANGKLIMEPNQIPLPPTS